jgi:hypothetical protein
MNSPVQFILASRRGQIVASGHKLFAVVVLLIKSFDSKPLMRFLTIGRPFFVVETPPN